MGEARIWRPVPSHPGYWASDDGQIRGRRGGIMVGGLTRDGYRRLTIMCAGGGQTNAGVHQMVCEAFHGPRPSPRHQAAHNDGNRSNNAPGNLRWATARENSADRVLHGTEGALEKHPRAKITNAQAREIYLRYQSERGCRPGVRAGLAAEYAISLRAVDHIIYGTAWAAATGAAA